MSNIRKRILKIEWYMHHSNYFCYSKLNNMFNQEIYWKKKKSHGHELEFQSCKIGIEKNSKPKEKQMSALRNPLTGSNSSNLFSLPKSTWHFTLLPLNRSKIFLVFEVASFSTSSLNLQHESTLLSWCDPFCLSFLYFLTLPWNSHKS